MSDARVMPRAIGDRIVSHPRDSRGGVATFSHHKLYHGLRSTRQEYDGMGTLIAVVVFCGLAIALWNASQKDPIIRDRISGNRRVPATPAGTPSATDPLI